MIHKPLRSSISQKGLTLLELLISLAILSGMVVGITQLMEDAGDEARASITALHTRTVGNAASEYIKDNYAAISALATATAPVLIRVPDLIETGYLTEGFSLTNARRQSTCVLVLEPTANRLTGLVITEGGDTIDDLALGQIASTIGGSGGGIYSTAPTFVRGAMGGYTFPVGAYGNPNSLGQRCDGTAGNITVSAGHPVMALPYADGVQASSTLYRDSVPGNPSLNTMNTPILLSAATVQVDGTACAPRGALARDAVGSVLACESDIWRKAGSTFWRDPVATFAALGICDATGRGHTRTVLMPGVGVGPRAYTCDGTGAWEALGLDDSGSLRVAGTATINRLAGTLEIAEIAVQNTACVRNGSIARDALGSLLSCQSGLWKGTGGGEAGMYAYFQSTSCPMGWRAANGTGGTVDLRGEFIRSWDAGRGVDPGRAVGTAQLDALQQIYGTFSNMEEPFAWGNGVFSGGAAGARWYGGTYYPSAPATMTFDSARVARSANETRGRNVALLACKKD